MPHTKRVFDALEASIPWIKERAGNPRSLLYVGWRHDCKPWWYDTLCKELGITKVGILEIFPKNVADFEQQIWAGRYEAQAIQGDVTQADRHIKPGEWDIIFWDHGPEHVTWDNLQKTTQLLYGLAGRLLLYCCPWGDWPQGEEDGNVHEVHRNAVTEKQFLQLGLWVRTFASPGQRNEGELLGFKFLNEYGASTCTSCRGSGSFDESSNRG